MAFEFYVKPIYYDNDFAFYVGDSRVDEQRTLRYTADTPIKAYVKFVEATTIHSFYGKDVGDGRHVASFRDLFYNDLLRAITSKGELETDSCLDIVFDADGCFDYCYGGNQEIEFGIRKVYEFNIKSEEDFKLHYLQIELERTKYLEKMLAEYNTDKFLPALDALELAYRACGKQLGLADKMFMKRVLKSARGNNPQIVPTIPKPYQET